MSRRSKSSSPSVRSNTATGLPLLVTTTGPFLMAFTYWPKSAATSSCVATFTFHLLPRDQQPVPFFHTDRLDLDFVMYFINSIKHSEAVIGPKPNFPGRLKWRRLAQRLTIPRLLCRLKLQLRFNLCANHHVIFHVYCTQMLFDRLRW